MSSMSGVLLDTNSCHQQHTQQSSVLIGKPTVLSHSSVNTLYNLLRISVKSGFCLHLLTTESVVVHVSESLQGASLSVFYMHLKEN